MTVAAHALITHERSGKHWLKMNSRPTAQQIANPNNFVVPHIRFGADKNRQVRNKGMELLFSVCSFAG